MGLLNKKNISSIQSSRIELYDNSKEYHFNTGDAILCKDGIMRVYVSYKWIKNNYDVLEKWFVYTDFKRSILLKGMGLFLTGHGNYLPLTYLKEIDFVNKLYISPHYEDFIPNYICYDIIDTNKLSKLDSVQASEYIDDMKKKYF